MSNEETAAIPSDLFNALKDKATVWCKGLHSQGKTDVAVCGDKPIDSAASVSEWKKSIFKDPMTDRTVVTYSLAGVDDRGGRSPMLMFQCEQHSNTMDYLYRPDDVTDPVYQPGYPQNGQPSYSSSVRFRIDDQQPKLVMVDVSPNFSIIFMHPTRFGAVKLIDAIGYGHRLILQTNVYPSTLITQTFNVAGLDRADMNNECAKTKR